MMNPQLLKSDEEQFERFYSRVLRKDVLQYDYRSSDGKLFSCIAPDLPTARSSRDAWVRTQEAAHA